MSMRSISVNAIDGVPTYTSGLSQSLDISQTPLQWIGEAKTVRVQNVQGSSLSLHSLLTLLEISSAVYKSSDHDQKS